MTSAIQPKWIEVPLGTAALAPEEPNEAIRAQAEAESRLHAELYVWADRFRALVAHQTGVELPEVALSVERGCKNRLGWYHIGRDGLQLRGRVSLNSRYMTRPICWVLSTLPYQVIHGAEELAGQSSKAKHSAYHTAWFREHAEDLGIPCDAKGASTLTDIDPSSPFGRLLVAHGIELVPMEVAAIALPGSNGSDGDHDGDDAGTAKTAAKYSCGCTNVRAYTELRARCLACGNDFKVGAQRGDPWRRPKP